MVSFLSIRSVIVPVHLVALKSSSLAYSHAFFRVMESQGSVYLFCDMPSNESAMARRQGLQLKGLHKIAKEKDFDFVEATEKGAYKLSGVSGSSAFLSPHFIRVPQSDEFDSALFSEGPPLLMNALLATQVIPYTSKHSQMQKHMKALSRSEWQLPAHGTLQTMTGREAFEANSTVIKQIIASPFPLRSQFPKNLQEYIVANIDIRKGGLDGGLLPSPSGSHVLLRDLVSSCIDDDAQALLSSVRRSLSAGRSVILSAYDAPSILHRKRYQEAGVDFDDDGLLKVTKETWDVAAQDSRFSYLWFLAMDVLGEKPKLSMADLSTRPIAEMIEDVKQADMLFMNERKAKSAEARKNKRESKTEDSKKPEPSASSEKPEPSASSEKPEPSASSSSGEPKRKTKRTSSSSGEVRKTKREAGPKKKSRKHMVMRTLTDL